MGITISGPSTQIPTNVVEVGNEITQNQLNAITASLTPSVGNPMQTQSAMVQYLNGYVWPSIINKTTQPVATPPGACNGLSAADNGFAQQTKGFLLKPD